MSAHKGRKGARGSTTRREVLGAAGLSAFLLGARSLAGPIPRKTATRALGGYGSLPGSSPFGRVNSLASQTVGGLPFLEGFTGDPWQADEMPFHRGETAFPGGQPPTPSETVDLAIVGGGLSGLSTAFFLREHRPVVFELAPRFGGVSRGEIWEDTRYSLGGAYFIAPDKGSFLERVYEGLGLDKVARVSYPEDDPIELNGVLRTDFFEGGGLSSADVVAFRKYAEVVAEYGEAYPEIPLIEGQDNDWIRRLDQKTLKEDLERRLGGPTPRLLASAIQAYCFSSFNASWDEISAAAGWNFIAAEEFGRWICPGGNAWVAEDLWRRLVEEYGETDAHRLRPSTRVVDVREGGGDMIQVTYKLPDGTFRSLLARHVVMACSKHICKYILHDLERKDPARLDSMHQSVATAYIVANVLLDQPIERDFYDMFLLDDGDIPQSAHVAESSGSVIDVITGHFARVDPNSPHVLTLYWPMPSPKEMFRALIPGAWEDFSARMAPQIHRILRLLDISQDAVQQVRISRWGHSMPFSRVNFITDGHPDVLRSPYLDRVWFVNQDNWALPAFETCLLEAGHFAGVLDDLL
jgi:hypothetical protein